MKILLTILFVLSMSMVYATEQDGGSPEVETGNHDPNCDKVIDGNPEALNEELDENGKPIKATGG